MKGVSQCRFGLVHWCRYTPTSSSEWTIGMWLPCISSDLFPSLPRLHAVYKRFFNHSTINTACTSQIKVSLHNFRPWFLWRVWLTRLKMCDSIIMGHPKFADSTCKCVANQCAQASYKVLGMHWVQGYDWRDWHACMGKLLSIYCFWLLLWLQHLLSV